MLISHLKKFIYLKTMKTASTSIEGYFEPYCTDEDPWVLNHARQDYESPAGIVGHRGETPVGSCTIKWYSHLSAKTIKLGIPNDTWSTYFKFCVIRNPYDRIVSMFYWERYLQQIPLEDDVPSQFQRWVEQHKSLSDAYIYTLDGELAVDKFIRYEHLQDDLMEVCGILDIPYEPNILSTFKSGCRPLEATCEAIYTKRAKALVRNASLFEIYKLGYEFPKS